jgi:osmotically-inducible protein OsmY
MRDGEIDASEMEVKVENGEVVLSGSVDSRRTKRRAEDVIDGISGVRDVRNELRVVRT